MFEDPPTLRFGRAGASDESPTTRMRVTRPVAAGEQPIPPDEQLTIPLAQREADTVALGKDETVQLGKDETVPPGTDETVPLGTDETVPLGTDETVRLGEDETLRFDDRRKHH